MARTWKQLSEDYSNSRDRLARAVLNDELLTEEEDNIRETTLIVNMLKIVWRDLQTIKNRIG